MTIDVTVPVFDLGDAEQSMQHVHRYFRVEQIVISCNLLQGNCCPVNWHLRIIYGIYVLVVCGLLIEQMVLMLGRLVVF